jgi:large subunit ribosomal protein L5
MIMENMLRTIQVEKITLNIGAGKNQEVLKKGLKLLEALTGAKPVQTVTQKRIPTWGLRPGLPIGCKVTLRGKKATDLIPNVLDAKSNTLKEGCFDSNGSIAFGIQEYIDIKGSKYDPEIGMLGLQVCITLQRPGFRIKKKRMRPGKITKKHAITQEEAIAFMQEKYKTKLEEKE